jgi:hypothetical protein
MKGTSIEAANRVELKVADETWIAVALLHREHPEREDFTISEIVERAKHEDLHGPLRPGVRVHATLHCVANLRPNPGRYRMLLATGKSTRRLYREGDPYDRAREGAKTVPDPREIPGEYRHLIDWYFSEYGGRAKTKPDASNSILALRGLGRELWSDEDADSYIRRLREGWE